jgi:hypothetical protein
MNILITRIYFILIITWSLAYGCGQQQIQHNKKCMQIDDDFEDHVESGGTMRGTSPNEAQPRLPLKPMDAAIGQVLALHCSGGRHGRRFWSKTQNTTKKLFLAS